MLDTETKRRIDTCRDILVGKVPDPKSQVEQITIALIYKFMDDMDAEAEELGGARSFFAGNYAKYGWARLMAPSLGGHDVLNLYSEAIGKMNENPGIPPLFRDIFKNAYLPYRDPETLRSFLKEIDGFIYDHSERLGDAFEYLLSVLGSQGDAGQFRTPRHIIDFMVEVIDPKKNESVLDPACGTAGFLISAWKHIVKQNTKERPGDQLTPEERANLASNIHGYDISPDMVRLSLVNMYLHGFTDPHIVEYDTLTSEERWNETSDVILANPPFMSPKGGIKPHKRFSVQATRSEVLFVDYMAEHLSPQGRAAIVVPEGIVFQSGAAYKQLREMLVKTSLVAVVSLPAGVFNPYSGVKTSILILDKRRAKTCDSVLFVKVDNDGFSLGAQRRVAPGDKLPDAKRHLFNFFESCGTFQNCAMAQKVTRAQIGEGGEWNLAADRYRIGPEISSSFEKVLIGDVISTITPPAKLQKESYLRSGRFPIIDQSQEEIAGWTDNEQAIVQPDKPLVIFGDHTCAVKLVRQPFVQGADGIKILETDDRLLPEFLYWFLKASPLETDGYKRHFADLKRKQVPLPSLAFQREIVAEMEGYQQVINGAKQVVKSYQPYIPVAADWPIVDLSEICSFKNGLNFDRTSTGTTLKIIGVSNFKANLYAPLVDLDEVHLAAPLADDYLVRGGDILFVRSNGNPELVGRSVIVPPINEPTTFSGFTIRARFVDERAFPLFYALYFKSRDFADMIKTVGRGANIRNLSQGILSEIKVPLPPIEIQKTIAAEIEAEQALVNVNQQLIERFEAKIKSSINRVWRYAG
jgi:type I restriction enzyme M protein